MRRAGAICGLLLTAILCVPTAYAQEPASSEPILIDEFGSLSHCDFRSRIDALLQELSQKPSHRGYVLIYKSTDELPGDRHSFPIENSIAQHISFRNFDRPRITFVRAGYLNESRTQFWLVPPGGEAPKGLDTLPEPPIQDKKSFLFANRVLASDRIVVVEELGMGVDENLPEFILKSVRERELAEQAEIEKRLAEEQREEAEASGEDPKVEPTVTEETANVSPVEEIAEPADSRTEEEREAARFEWADVGLADLISARKGSTGVIIFYADDKRYDIAKIRSFIRVGRDLLARNGRVASSRITFVFGGYRDTPEVEFWFVPAKGKAPVPTPSERPVEEPEEPVEN
jgi:hypothetical protein